MLITHSGTSSIFCKVCLVVLFRALLEGEKITIAGLVEKRLKKLNGLRFTLPEASIVLAEQIGLGAMAACNHRCLSISGKDSILIVIISVPASQYGNAAFHHLVQLHFYFGIKG